jgi:hypothetical protein
MPLDNKISNIIGTKLPQWVLNQLETRSNKNTQDSRDNDNILYLANKSAWVRLVSSVNINDYRDSIYFKNIVGANLETDNVFGFLTQPDSLAKQYVLFGGTSKYLNNNSYGLRSGLDYDGAYGMLGKSEVQQFGYKPMPGITSVTIETQGRLGSVRSATINFKCWDKNQLDIIDALYFKLGFTMFLEWGHTFYYPSPQNTSKRNPDKIISTELYSIDPFEKGLNKEDIQIRIAKNSRETEGNYDGMLGICTNFNFTYTQDGGYDCTLRLMALGVLGDSIKINNAGTLPNLLEEEIKQLNNTLIEIAKANAASQVPIDTNPFAPPAPSNDILSNLVVDLGLYESGFAPQRLYAQLPELVLKGIAFANNDAYSEKAKKELRIELAKSANKIVVFPYEANFKISDSNEYKTLDAKKFYSLDYAIPQSSRYYISGIKRIIDKNQTYSEISLDIPRLKDRYIKSFPANNKKPFYETVFDTEKPGDPTWNGELIKGYSLSIGGIDKTKNYIYGIQYKNSLGKIYYFNIIIDLRGSFNTEGSKVTVGDVSIADLRSKFETKLSADSRKLILKKLLENGDSYLENFVFSKEYFNEAKGWPDFSYQFNLQSTIASNIQLTDPEDGAKINAVYSVGVKIVFNDSDIFNNISPEDENLRLTAYGQTIRARDIAEQNINNFTDLEEQKNEQDAISTQIKQALNYQSTLEIMLRTIQLHALNKAINQTGTPDLEIGRTTYVLNIWDPKDSNGGTTFLNQIFSTGIFNTFITDLVNDTNIESSDYTTDKKMDPIKRFKIHSKHGFASSLLANKEAIGNIPAVNFKELLTAYVVPYQIDQEIIKGTSTNHPVYIPLGLVLMILNHACTIYDSKEQGKFQTPLVYIDFNPEVNFCLTNTKQLSTDPWTCLIPIEGSFEDYKQLFDKNILTSENNAIQPVSGSEQTVPLFNPDTEDYLSKKLPKLKFDVYTSLENKPESGNVYRGKVMNILMSIDYLVELAQQYSYKDGTNSVYLKTFIEQMLSDINKSLGNFNSFRLSYNDSANTFQIVDDQFVPSLSSEPQVTPKSNTTEIPLVGKFSIAKSLEIKSEVSSRLSNMLAISANSNSANKATLSTNGDSFGFINTAYSDRYITIRGEITGSTEPSKQKNDSLKESAAQFNSAISDFYSKINPSQTTVAHATNYYIEKMTLVKNNEYATRAAAMIPLSVNFTTDGISGLGMGQAFTVSDQILPYTYTTRKIPGAPQDHINNVGFVMVGLTHTIENNQWNTAVRANMIYLKDKTEFTGSVVKTDFATGLFGVNQSNQFSSYVTPKDVTIPTGDARKNLVESINKTASTTGIKMLALAQTLVEGYYPNTAAYKNNNPGNIRSVGGPFRQFSTLQEGSQALVDYINRAVNKENKNYTKADTLSQYINVYAPSEDNNDPNSYIATILGYFKKVGVNKFNANSLMKDISSFNESVNLS